jgi:hypothetical protein
MKLPLSFAALIILGAVAGREASAQGTVLIPAQVPVEYPVPYQPVPVCPDPLGTGECMDPPQCRSRWFGSIDLSLLAPHVTNHQRSSVNVAGFVDSAHLPGGPLDWTVSPTFSLGYRLNSGLAIEATYQNVSSEGRFWLWNFDPSGRVPMWSCFNLDRVDLDITGIRTPLTTPWEFRWRAGARIAAAYFNTRAEGDIIEQRITNRFVGAGPHVGLEAWRVLPVHGLFLFGKLDGAFLVGGARQRFEESLLFTDGSIQSGTTQLNSVATPWTYRVEVGLCLAPPSVPWLRVTGAYQYEQWWGFGNGSSQTHLILQGPILRGEFNY